MYPKGGKMHSTHACNPSTVKYRPIKIDESFFLRRMNYYTINSIDRIIKVFMIIMYAVGVKRAMSR